jgi:hypothetical protein
MNILELGSLKDRNSRAYRYLTEACKEGFIDQSELPEKGRADVLIALA